jgi:predicted nucleic acid-binding protein
VADALNPAGLIDTDILIDSGRGVGEARQFVSEQHTAGAVRISIISAMELIRGCRNARELRQVQTLLAEMTVLPVSVAASETAYRLIEALYLSHGLAVPDALIAATAIEHGLAVYTRNVRHFEPISGLKVIRPY